MERTEDGYQFSLRTCPLASLALEYGDLCCDARSLIGSLVGQEVEQSEWILRGDPRCTFHVRTEPARRNPPARGERRDSGSPGASRSPGVA